MGGPDLVNGNGQVETAVDGVVNAASAYDRSGVNLQGEKNVELAELAASTLAKSPWFHVEQSLLGLAPILVRDSGAPFPKASMFGLGIATSKGMCDEAPVELLAMIAGHIIFNRGMGMPHVNALLATDIGFKAGSLGTLDDYAQRERLEDIILAVMKNAAQELKFGQQSMPSSETAVELRWTLDADLQKVHGLMTRAAEIRRRHTVPDGASEHFYNYLAMQNAYVEAYLLGKVEDPKYTELLGATIKGGWHIGLPDFKGTEVNFDTQCVGLGKMGFFYGSPGFRVAPGDPKKYRPPYGHYPKDDYVIPLLKGQDDLLARLLSGVETIPSQYKTADTKKQWVQDYAQWTESLVQLCDLVAEAFITVRLDFASIGGGSGLAARQKLVETGPTSEVWKGLVDKSNGGKNQKFMNQLRSLQEEYENLKAAYVLPRMVMILNRFGAEASLAA